MSLVSELKTIADYNPTAYVNNSEPDLDAEHLNKTEQALKRVTDAANDAINALKELEEQKLSLNAIVQTESTATDKVPSSAYLKQALGTINSNFDAYYSLIAPEQIIGSNANLNNYVTPGQYKTESATISNTIINTPYKRSGFKLTVEYLSNSSHIMQTLKAVNSGYDYFRTGVCSDNVWSWTEWCQVITNADYEAKTITNSYGLTIISYTFGNDSIKALKMQGYINKALTAGTEYTLATNAILKSRVNWYHNVLFGGKSKNSICYLNIDTSGNFKITPQAAFASGDAMSIMEYYV